MNFEEMLMTLGQENADVNFQPTAGGPNLMSLLTGQAQDSGPTQPTSQTGLPPASPVDNSLIGPLMLLRMAANVSGRRQYGQSKLNQALMAASDAGDYGMSVKKQNEDQALKARESQRRDAVDSKNMEVADANLAMSRQKAQQEAELHPLIVAGRRAGLETSQIEATLKQKELENYDQLYALKVESLKNKNAEDAAMFKVQEEKLRVQRGEIQNALRALALGQDRFALEREQKERALPRELSKGDPELGGGSFSYSKGGKDYVYYNPLTSRGALEQAKADLKARGGDFTPEMVQARAAELMKPRLLELTKDGPKWVSDADAAAAAPTAGAPVPKAGQPTNQMAPTEPQFKALLERLNSLPPGAVVSDKGAYYVLGADKKSIQTATKEQINFANGKQPEGATPPAAPSPAVNLPEEFVAKLKKYPDVEMPGPDGNSYVYYSTTKEVKSTGKVKPYRRLMEPE